METKAVPGWAKQEDVTAGSGLADTACSTGRGTWKRRKAISGFLWSVATRRFLVAEASIERSVGTDDASRLAIDCFGRGRRL